MKNETPAPPLTRVTKEGVGVFCDICNSTMSRSGFMGLVGKRYCDNKECKNSKPSCNSFKYNDQTFPIYQSLPTRKREYINIQALLNGCEQSSESDDIDIEIDNLNILTNAIDRYKKLLQDK